MTAPMEVTPAHAAASPDAVLTGVSSKVIQGRSLGRIAWIRLRRDRVAVAGGVIVVLLVAAAVIGPFFVQNPDTYHPGLINPTFSRPNGPLGGISLAHPFGVEPQTGRDMLARIVVGARYSLLIGFLATVLAVTIGVLMGIVAGYFGGWLDSLIARLMDVFLAFPLLVFAIALIGVIPGSAFGLSGNTLRVVLLIFIIGFFAWPYMGRIIRGQALSLREREFVDAARSLGARGPYILFRELLPNLVGPILVYSTQLIPTNILFEAALDYLGVGLVPPAPSWGGTLSNAVLQGFYSVHPMYMIIPGMAIFITIMAFNLFGPSAHKGGTIIYHNAGTPDSTDAGNTYYAFNLNFTRLYATPLTTYKSCPGNCGAGIVPALATSLGTVSDNGLTWTYHIKPGVKFEDGTTVTSADVKYAVERTFDRSVLPNGPSYFATLLGGNAKTYPGPYKNRSKNLMGLTAIDTPDPATVVFHLNQPFADFNYVVAFPQTAPVPPAKDTGANYQLHPLSTGPYMFQSYQLNKQYTLVPNPQWNPSWNPQVKQLASKIIVNLNVNAPDIDNRLLAGDIQVDQAGSGVQAAARARILSSSSLKASSDDPVTGFMWFYYINTKVPPLNNVHCREAVEFAANKTNLQTAYGGPYGGSIASTAMPPTVLGYTSFDLYHALSKPGGDIAAAKQQLTLCGHPNGFTVNIAYRSDRPREVASSQALQAALSAAGIKASLKGYTAANYFGTFAGVPTYVHSHSLGLLAGGWGPDWPDAYGWGWALFDSKAIVSAGNANIAELSDPNVDKWFMAMEEAPSQAQRNSYSAMIDMQVMKDAVLLPATYNKALLYRSPALTNVYAQTYYGMYDYGVLGMKP